MANVEFLVRKHLSGLRSFKLLHNEEGEGEGERPLGMFFNLLGHPEEFRLHERYLVLVGPALQRIGYNEIQSIRMVDGSSATKLENRAKFELKSSSEAVEIDLGGTRALLSDGLALVAFLKQASGRKQ